MNLAEILKSAAQQSGVSETELKPILDNATLSSIEVDEAVSTKLVAPRLTMDAAKNNPDLKKHFSAQVIDGFEAELYRTATELGLDADAVSEIKGLDSAFKRVSGLAKKVKDIEAAKAGKGSADTEKLNKQIEELNGQILKVREETAVQLQAKDASLENERIGLTLNNMLSNYDYATNVDKDINITLANSLIQKELSAKGLRIVRKDNTLALITSEGTEYFDNNAKVSVNDFAARTLANAKVLKASNSGTTTQTQRHQPVINKDNPIKNADSIIAQLDKG